MFFVFTVLYTDETVRVTAFENVYREKHGRVSSVAGLKPYVFSALVNTFSCVFQSVTLKCEVLISVFQTLKEFLDSILLEVIFGVFLWTTQE